MYFFITVGGIAGSYVPSLWHAGALSAWGIIGGLIGGLAGIWAALKVRDYVDL